MQKDFDALLDILKKFQGFSLIDSSVDPAWVQFKLGEEAMKTFSSYVGGYPTCTLLTLNNPDNLDDISYQLLIDGDTKTKRKVLKGLAKKFLAHLDAGGDMRKIKNQELGLPDLSLVTIRQMANELKQRQNLTFAVVWIENNERDNIAIEGSGNPTQLVGLLARGLHMGIEWADKNIRFYRPKDEE